MTVEGEDGVDCGQRDRRCGRCGIAAVAAVGARHVVLHASEGFMSVQVDTRVSFGYESDGKKVCDRSCQPGIGA